MSPPTAPSMMLRVLVFIEEHILFLLFPSWNQMHAGTFNFFSVRDTYILYTVKPSFTET